MAPEIDGKVYISEIRGLEEGGPLPSAGTRATVEITRAMEYDLVGRVIEWTRNVATGAGSQSLSPSRLARISTSVTGLVQINAAINGVTSPSSLTPAFARMDAR
jgi:hypothetical protein